MIIHLDNSAFSLLSCDYHFQLRVIQGKVEGKGTAADFGDGVHKALEYYDKGQNDLEVMASLQAIGYKSLPKILKTAAFVRASKPLPPPIDIDGHPAVEVKFSHKYASFLLPSSNELLDIYLDGTIDRLYLDGDTLVIADYKTTAHAKPDGIDKVLSSYATSFQLPFYLYALLKFPGILPASYIDYLTSNHYRMEIILITHNTEPPGVKFYQRHSFPAATISHTIPLIIHNKIQQALAIAQLQSPAPKTGFTVYDACRLCGFRPACLSDGTPREDEILSRYEVQPYNPLTFR